ncbi:bacteriohemerythrin [Caenispirillum bisanense]|uniref:bacteriohemerythrin n=1 Tax=Caenispirillum bisanense TaxID=414052 RepID=UPI0011425ED8|nr:hemerythrin family protein [Caenispirillum bisanense]
MATTFDSAQYLGRLAETMGLGPLSVSDRLLDDHHRRLLSCLIRCSEAANRWDAAPETIVMQLEEYLDAERQHFMEEEALLRESGYVAVDTHAEDHGALAKRGRLLVAAVERGDMSAEAAVLGLASNFVDHVLRDDLLFKSHLEFRGQMPRFRGVERSLRRGAAGGMRASRPTLEGKP